MVSAATIRMQVESALARKIPSALTPQAKMVRPVAATGIEALDDVLRGGLPIGAVSELVGPECSGRTSLALSFLAQVTQAGKVCAWIDVSNTFDPLSAAAIGVDLARLLWVRCGVQAGRVEPTSRNFSLPEKYLAPPSIKKGLHGGGFGPHPRTEANGLSTAVSGLLHPQAFAPRCAEPQRSIRPKQQTVEPVCPATCRAVTSTARSSKPWTRIEQALRSADLLLQGGGFSAIVLDMGSLAPEFASRVPLATWHRYRLASERTQSSILLLTQHPCAKSSAELLLRLRPATSLADETKVFTGLQPHAEVARQRFTQNESNIVSIRKPPQRVNTASWRSRMTWAGRR
ncbi:RecA protein [Granulicella sibirica]|uniref:Protein RecA n=2 Tax=Granulicella sibirica TaxID=2479048 RepID=A0A4Q0T2M9_9BACT|nr:RecA protein [Granulicella sibirica]